MELNTQHHAAIQLLIENRFSDRTLEEIAQEIGVSDRTLRRWRDDTDFQNAYERALEQWRRDFSDIRLADRKERVRELQRLYESTPDSYITRIIESETPIINADGHILRDEGGRPIMTVAVSRLNVDAKARLINQIAEEVGDKDRREEPEDPYEVARQIREALRQMQAKTQTKEDKSEEDEAEDAE